MKLSLKGMRNFAREIDAQFSKIEPLMHAWRLTAVLPRRLCDEWVGYFHRWQAKIVKTIEND